MYTRDLMKADGRTLSLYSRRPIAWNIQPSLLSAPEGLNPHLRWHPLRGEWVAYAAYRQGRTFHPPPEYNPFAPSDDPDNPTELPCGDYDIAVFDNRFPALTGKAHDPPESLVSTLPAKGHCEVVVFTQDPQSSLGRLPLDHIELLLEVWGRRTEVLAMRRDVRYVLPFENRGAEVGVTLHHPHGQIYAYPFVPPFPERIHQNEAEHFEKTGGSLLQELIAAEAKSGERVLYLGEHAIAFVPAWARYPYEVWVAPIVAVPSFLALNSEQRADLAAALKTVLLKYDGLWQRPFPYLMAWYQAPVDRRQHPECHLHAEFYPPYRTEDRLKYLAGTELAAGMFANDALPEEKARELKAVAVAW
ncbi:galactose-1-phosphate uridylyltransferase [Methylocaldum gracile]|jgi:UDPglucose--hexose-1-phosphate uridylyltransferase|uniref:galactose-1-phosphate uridylyltransferase n=1 Tax=Methylocaldum sp. 0917 TaxID=2485163 RepID=UPI00105B5028